MISDNDYATGLVVEAISNSKFWKDTAIFIVEDDPQQGADHVDYHRSILVVASPWAKRGHTSHVHASYPSLFRSFELILGLPPMNRYDALATPLYAAFTMKADSKPYTALERKVPDGYNTKSSTGADWSATMDFDGPIAHRISGISCGGHARVRRRRAHASPGSSPQAVGRARTTTTTTATTTANATSTTAAGRTPAAGSRRTRK